MAQAAATDTAEAVAAHRGSASTSLTGSAVLMVWLISTAIHVGALAIMLVWVFPFGAPEPADMRLAHVDVVGRLDAESIATNDQLDSLQERSEADPLDSLLAPTQSDHLTELTAPKKPELSIIGLGAGGGDFSKYGLTAGGGAGPQFFGLGASARGARRIVYVVDRSGSMLDTFAHVKAELKRSIGELRRSQKFHVIFFNSGEPLENPPMRMVSAVKAQQQAFFQFLGEVFPAGSTHPERAMRRAFATDPDMIYFLTDGAFSATLLEKLDKWNRNRQVRIFTIAFFDRSGAELLNRIARDHGGEFKFVSEDDLP